MNKLATVSSMLNPLLELQKNYCLLVFSGDLKIGFLPDIANIKSGRRTSDISMYSEKTGISLMKRFLENLAVNSDKRQTINDFMDDPNTILYRDTAFTPLPTSSETLNYWIPPKITGCEGNWDLFHNFLKDIICNGDPDLFSYLLHYLAHMLQKPEEKPEVMLVLLGGQGTGKGSFLKLLQAIWPATLVVSDIDHIIGGFNSALERSFIVCMDEALFAGQKKAMDRLKSFITEPTVTVERKFQDRRTIDSVHRFFATSNHSHFGNIPLDDRRFVFFRVSEKYKRDHNYFQKFNDALKDSSQLPAIVHFLNGLDLTNFNVREKPETTELLRQKLKSLDGFSRYWYEVLNRGFFDVAPMLGTSLDRWEDAQFIASEKLCEHFGVFQKGSRQQYQPIQINDISLGMKEWCPIAENVRKTHNNFRTRGYQLPALIEAREEFERMIGGKIEW